MSAPTARDVRTVVASIPSVATTASVQTGTCYCLVELSALTQGKNPVT